MNRHRMNPYNMHPYNHMGEQVPDQDMQDLPEPETNLPAEELPEVEDQIHFSNLEGNDNPAEEETPNQDTQETLEEKLKEERLRMAAEMDNFKKRLQREHQDQIRYASEKVLTDILPALDNLDLALQYGSQNEACKDMVMGIEMTRKQLLEAVAKSGLIALGEKGEQFDPAIHEAIGIAPDDSLEKGAVSQVMQKGYKLNDRTLRPAKVMVNN